MRRTFVSATALAVAVVASTVGLATVARPAPDPPGPSVGPTVPPDTGAGEQLLVVLGGVYPTRAEADAAAAATAFGDLQGYYVAPVAQFQGFREQLGLPGEFALVSAFRTQEGAEAFVEVAQMFGQPATLLPERVRSLGGVYVGLGQEANPDGTGPLLGPVPESLP